MSNRLPAWFRQDLPQDAAFSQMHLLSEFNVNTVCKEAKCPNLSRCFSQGRLTFVILGDTCTRNCRFCAVNKADTKPLGIDLDEPLRIRETVKKLGLGYVVITSVTRDDLEDGGASIFSQVIELIHALNREIKVEVLIPDFQAKDSSLQCVLDAGPDVVAHNIETVKRLYPHVRAQADYRRSQEVLRRVKELDPSLITKSSLMLGLGETEDEVREAMEDLIGAHCDILTLGQYLSPSGSHYPVKEFIAPQRFMRYKELGIILGFKAVLSGPLVRSSYQAEELYQEFNYV
ncbi:MAG: lipoyl synthase [Candidatus Omnitrophica bacterium]|nr:lipoyl synthase [Candidatus Omnitrophota bacterium]